MGIPELVAKRRNDILRIAAKHGVQRIRVFGSVARGEAGPQSDVDFLIEVGPQHSAFFPGGLVAAFEALLGRHADVMEPAGLDEPLKAVVLKEAAP